MIQDVDETLRRMLAAELSKTPGCPVYDAEQITFDPPAIAEALQDGEAHINLYLHDVRENLDLRDESRQLVSKPEEGLAARRRGHVRLNLGYLVTVYAGEDPATEHRLLSDVLCVLFRYLAAPVEYLSGVLEDGGPHTLLLSVAQPEHVANADPPGLWQALGGRLRPALSLVATAPFDPYETKWTKVIREAIVALGKGEEPHAPRQTAGSSFKVSAAGLVLDQESEEPLAQAEVQIRGREETAVTDGKGLFYLLNLPPGSYALGVRKWGYREQELRVVVPQSGRPEPWEPSVVALRRWSDAEWAAEAARRTDTMFDGPGRSDGERPRRVSLAGRLCYSDGRPAAFLPVRAGRRRTQTDADGLYVFIDLPPGERTLVAEVPGRGDVEIVTHDGGGVVALDDAGSTRKSRSSNKEESNA